MAHTLASIGVVFRDGRVLLVFARDEQYWQAPGGHVEPGETPDETIVRELREELGVGASVVALVGVYTLKAPEVTHYRFIFRCELEREPRIAAPEEIEELGWFDPDELPEPQSLSMPHAVADTVAGRSGVTRTLEFSGYPSRR